jgi:hypothetical protein
VQPEQKGQLAPVLLLQPQCLQCYMCKQNNGRISAGICNTNVYNVPNGGTLESRNMHGPRPDVVHGHSYLSVYGA